MDWFLKTPIAHRGLHGSDRNAPENSMAAFEAALAAGYPIELDVRVLRDSAVAVFHDENLLRMTGVDSPLEEHNAVTLTKFRLLDTDQSIPLLADVLDLIDGKTPVLVELKNFGPAGALETAVRDLLVKYQGASAVQSFNPLSMAWFRQQASQITRGQLSGDFRDSDVDETLRKRLQHLEWIATSDPAFIGYDIRCLPFGPVEKLRARGIPVLGWTVKSEDDRTHALKYCDNIIFEGIVPPN